VDSTAADSAAKAKGDTSAVKRDSATTVSPAVPTEPAPKNAPPEPMDADSVTAVPAPQREKP
jgi:hypothetical protein